MHGLTVPFFPHVNATACLSHTCKERDDFEAKAFPV